MNDDSVIRVLHFRYRDGAPFTTECGTAKPRHLIGRRLATDARICKLCAHRAKRTGYVAWWVVDADRRITAVSG